MALLLGMTLDRPGWADGLLLGNNSALGTGTLTVNGNATLDGTTSLSLAPYLAACGHLAGFARRASRHAWRCDFGGRVD
ncbi:hypothetical protein [Bradyrhizobium altum]|uniref:hypothetical protein n=1 Tax=Bradyrhizobium altum TaxID=1571202 RepID=UPI001E3DA220|nr:hypothetical protein [Bradyrhizobium altum]